VDVVSIGIPLCMHCEIGRRKNSVLIMESLPGDTIFVGRTPILRDVLQDPDSVADYINADDLPEVTLRLNDEPLPVCEGRRDRKISDGIYLVLTATPAYLQAASKRSPRSNVVWFCHSSVAGPTQEVEDCFF
jgi:hypothetical protein